MDFVSTDSPLRFSLAPSWCHRDLSELEAGVGVLWSLGQHSNTQARSSLVAALLCGSAASRIARNLLPRGADLVFLVEVYIRYPFAISHRLHVVVFLCMQCLPGWTGAGVCVLWPAGQYLYAEPSACPILVAVGLTLHLYHGVVRPSSAQVGGNFPSVRTVGQLTLV